MVVVSNYIIFNLKCIPNTFVVERFYCWDFSEHSRLEKLCGSWTASVKPTQAQTDTSLTAGQSQQRASHQRTCEFRSTLSCSCLGIAVQSWTCWDGCQFYWTSSQSHSWVQDTERPQSVSLWGQKDEWMQGKIHRVFYWDHRIATDDENLRFHMEPRRTTPIKMRKRSWSSIFSAQLLKKRKTTHSHKLCRRTI